MKKNTKHRLKIYIPQWKYAHWEKYLQNHYPYSEFFFNFSQWVRNALKNIPKSHLLINHQNISSGSDSNRPEEKIEKTVWVSKSIYTGLKQTQGLMSLNTYVLYLLDNYIFSNQQMLEDHIHLLSLKQRIKTLEQKIDYLFDKVYSRTGK